MATIFRARMDETQRPETGGNPGAGQRPRSPGALGKNGPGAALGASKGSKRAGRLVQKRDQAPGGVRVGRSGTNRPVRHGPQRGPRGGASRPRRQLPVRPVEDGWPRRMAGAGAVPYRSMGARTRLPHSVQEPS
ncbi:hypothetical protein JCM13210_17680 [Thermaerobacter litoralis]